MQSNQVNINLSTTQRFIFWEKEEQKKQVLCSCVNLICDQLKLVKKITYSYKCTNAFHLNLRCKAHSVQHLIQLSIFLYFIFICLAPLKCCYSVLFIGTLAFLQCHCHTYIITSLYVGLSGTLSQIPHAQALTSDTKSSLSMPFCWLTTSFSVLPSPLMISP